MPCGHSHPALLLDVDGVISLFGFDFAARPIGSFTTVDGILHYVSGHAAAQLDRLRTRFDLVWCTGWEEKANEHLVGLLGLPAPLPTLRFEAGPRTADGRHWKLAAIEAHLGDDRPAAWVDDDHAHPTVEAWLAARPGPTLLVRTEPAIGLTDAMVDLLLEWAATVTAS